MVDSYWFILRQRWLIIIGLAALVAPLVYGVLTSRPVEYTSMATVEVGTGAVTEQIIGQQRAYVEPERRVIQESDAITSRPVAELAAVRLGLASSQAVAEELLSRVDATPRPGTNYIDLVGTGPTPEAAHDLTEAFSNAYVDYRAALLRADLERLEQDLLQQRLDAEAELQALPDGPAAARDRAALTSRIDNAIRLAEAVRLRLSIEATGVEVLAPPTTPTEPSNAVPPALAAVAGLLAALFVTLAGTFGYEFIRDGVRTPREAEEISGAPTIAAVGRTGRRTTRRLLPGAQARRIRLGLAAVHGGALPSRVLVVAADGDLQDAHDVAHLLAVSCRDTGVRVLVVSDGPDNSAGPAEDTIDPAIGTLPLRGGLVARESSSTGVWTAVATTREKAVGLFDVAAPAEALAGAAEHFEVIVVVASHQDGVEPGAVHHLVDSTLLVCSLGRTSARRLRALVERLARVGCGIDAVVVTAPARSLGRREGRPPGDRDVPRPVRPGREPLASAGPPSSGRRGELSA